MNYTSTKEFFAAASRHIEKGPIALIFAEDQVETLSSIAHHAKLGFKTVIAFGKSLPELPEHLEHLCVTVKVDLYREARPVELINQVSALVPKEWVYYCFNSEYLFYPFMENRSVVEMLAFHAEERRDAMLTYVIDLYAKDLEKFPNAVALDQAYFDRAGHYALARWDPNTNSNKDRQLNIFGGLRWRFEEYLPYEKRRIDRISIFRAQPENILKEDFTFTEEEYNTYSCPWHHNLTAAIVSFRTAKALRYNPGSKHDIEAFHWHNSIPFAWSSKQLLDLGLIESGQWF